MSDIADFLRARYAEQRALVEAAAEDAGKEWSPGDEHLSSSVNDGVTGAAVVIGPWEYLDWDVRRHIAAHDPAAVLADLDAKLAIVDEHPAAPGWDGREIDGQVCRTCSETSQDGELAGDPYPCRTLRLLARPFVEHPDHKGEGWAP